MDSHWLAAAPTGGSPTASALVAVTPFRLASTTPRSPRRFRCFRARISSSTAHRFRTTRRLPPPVPSFSLLRIGRCSPNSTANLPAAPRPTLAVGHCATRGSRNGGRAGSGAPTEKQIAGRSPTAISERAGSFALGAPRYAPPSVKQILNEPDRVAAGCFRGRARARALWPPPWHRHIRGRIVCGAHLGLAWPAPR